MGLNETEVEEVYSDLSSDSVLLKKRIDISPTCCGRGCCFNISED